MADETQKNSREVVNAKTKDTNVAVADSAAQPPVVDKAVNNKFTYKPRDGVAAAESEEKRHEESDKENNKNEQKANAEIKDPNAASTEHEPPDGVAVIMAEGDEQTPGGADEKKEQKKRKGTWACGICGYGICTNIMRGVTGVGCFLFTVLLVVEMEELIGELDAVDDFVQWPLVATVFNSIVWVAFSMVSLLLCSQVLVVFALIFMRKCVASVYVGLLAFFLIPFALSMALGIGAGLLTINDNVLQYVNPVLLLVVAGRMTEEKDKRLGVFNRDVFEQKFKCCGASSPEEFWNTKKRIAVITKVFGPPFDQLFSLWEGDPMWHVDCMKANNNGQLSTKQPMCYAPRSCCREDKPGCNQARITPDNLQLTLDDLQSIQNVKLVQQIMQNVLDTQNVQDKTQYANLNRAIEAGDVKPMHPDLLYTAGCLSKVLESVNETLERLVWYGGATVFFILLMISFVCSLCCCGMQ